MKKILLLVSVFCASFALKAQNIILCENFNTYDSASAASGIFNGFVISYHDHYSFYTSTQSSGASGPNSYKFGLDSATMVTPDITGATYIQFWMKGNSTDSLSTFYVYDSPNGTAWTLVQAINPINTSGIVRQYPLHASAAYVKFFYHKSVGNVAFDDFCSTDGPVGVGIASVDAASTPTLSPNPSDGFITIRSNNAQLHNMNVTVTNILGRVMKTFVLDEMNSNSRLDLTSLDNGVYFVRIKSDKAEYLQRLVLSK